MGDFVRLHAEPVFQPHSPLFGDREVIATLIPGGHDLHWQHVFADDVWDLAGHPAWKPKHGTATQLDFTRVTERWRTAAKEMCLLQLNPSLAADRAPKAPMSATWSASQEPVLPVTAQANLKMLSHALGALDRFHISTFDDETWDRIQQLLIQPQSKEDKREGATLAPATGRGRAQQLIALWQVTHIAARVPLLGSVVPFRGQETVTLYARRSQRNSVRPDEAVGHVLGFCAWLIDHAAEDIVARVEWWAPRADDPPLGQEQLREAMLDLVLDIAERNSGRVPAVRRPDGRLSFGHSILARACGEFDDDQSFSAGRWVFGRIKDDVVLDVTVDACPMPLTKVASTDGGTRPWTGRLTATNAELDHWQRLLVYAAMYYLSATLMLRDSQLSLLPLHPIDVQTRTRPDGSVYKTYTLRAWKTKNRHSPTPTSVVVNARVARIISLLQRLQLALGYEPARSDVTGQHFLFDYRLAVPKGRAVRSGAREGIYLDQGFNRLIIEAAARLHADGVLARDLNGAKVSMRQVRITAAQAYASREHGAALSAAFGQWTTRQVADGYVGDVYKRLITPVEPEDVTDILNQATGRTLVQAASKRKDLSGKGLPRLDQAIERTNLPLANQTPLTPSRLASIGKKNRNIHQGTLSLCIYQPEGALCGSQAGPDFMHCQPGACRNSVMTPADRARYELRRRAYLLYDTAVGRRGANKLDSLNPEIAMEFRGRSDDDLRDIIRNQYEAYIADALGEQP